jgi:hypothetical protein
MSEKTTPRPVGRPYPPAELFDPMAPATFVPDDGLTAWLLETFVAEDAELLNEDHAHLRFATIGALWTNVGNSRQKRRIVGQCELGQPRATQGKWAKARAEQQILGWFGDVPDFILTLDASYAANCTDAEFCALTEHELYHAGQDLDGFGQPKFTKEGRPMFAMKGHDIEQFVGVVRRYGAQAAGVSALVEAAKGRPEVASASISGACGTCLLRAA